VPTTRRSSVEGQGSCASISRSDGSCSDQARRRWPKPWPVSPDSRFYAIGRQDWTVDEYDARSLRLVRHHTLDNAVQTLVFSPEFNVR